MTKTIATPEHLAHFDYNTEPFTDIELHVIAQYEETDRALKWIDLSDGNWPEEMSSADIAEQCRAYFQCASEWYEALDSLKSGLRNPGEGPAHSEAATRYLKSECIDWYHNLHMLRREACKHAYGTAGPQPEVEAGYLTFFDIPGIELDGRIAAESTY